MRTIALFLGYYSGAAYAIVNPLFGTLLFMHMLLLRPEFLVWGNRAFGRLYLAVFLCALLGLLSGGSRPSSNNRWSTRGLLVLGAFVVWSWFASLVAEHSVDASVSQAIDLSKIWLLCWLLSCVIIERRAITAYVTVVGGSAALVGLWGIFQARAGNPRLDELGIGGSNFLAAELVLVTPMCLVAALGPRRALSRRLVYYGIPALLVVLCIFYTGSRGGFLGLAASLVFLAMTVGRKRLAAVLGVAIVGAVLVSSLVPARVSDRLRTTFVSDVDELDTSAAARTALWQIAVRAWAKHPIVGVGLYNFSAAKDELFRNGEIEEFKPDIEEHIINQPRFPHSMYLGLLAETGAVGVILIAWVIGRAVLARLPRSLGSRDEVDELVLLGRGVQAGVMGFAVAACFGDFQYIELLYAQIMLIGAVRGASTAEAAERERGAVERSTQSDRSTPARADDRKLSHEDAH